MIVIKHPTLPVERLVPKDALNEWLAAGWVHATHLRGERGPELFIPGRHGRVVPTLAALTVPDLRAHAAEHGIDLAGATRKADILAAIKASHVSTAASAADRPADTQEGEAQ